MDYSTPLLHLVGSVCLLLLDDGQRMSLGVEDPVLEGKVVVVGEEQVQIPGGDKNGEVQGLLPSMHCLTASSPLTSHTQRYQVLLQSEEKLSHDLAAPHIHDAQFTK